MKKLVKAQADAIVNELARLPAVEECYEMWRRLQYQLVIVCACLIVPDFDVNDLFAVAKEIIIDLYTQIAGISIVLAGLMSAVAVIETAERLPSVRLPAGTPLPESPPFPPVRAGRRHMSPAARRKQSLPPPAEELREALAAAPAGEASPARQKLRHPRNPPRLVAYPGIGYRPRSRVLPQRRARKRKPAPHGGTAQRTQQPAALAEGPLPVSQELAMVRPLKQVLLRNNKAPVRQEKGKGSTPAEGTVKGGGPAVRSGTKNNLDLAAYAVQAWKNNWGYVWGTYGNVLTESLFAYKLKQYPDGVGKYKEFIRTNWLGRRTADCVGLIKGYGWLDASSGAIRYGTNGMSDYGANQMYQSAAVKGSMDTMPEIKGLAVWKPGHIGVYIGNGFVVEAMGTKYGVVRTKVEGRGWCKVPSIQYISE